MDAIKRVAINAAVKEAVTLAESDIAVQAVVDAIKRAAINADEEVDVEVNNLRGEIKRLHLLLATKQVAAADARAAANEAAATINRLEEENKRILLQLAAESAAMAETTNVGEAVMASSPVPSLTYEPSWKEHIPSQLGAPIIYKALPIGCNPNRVAG